MERRVIFKDGHSIVVDLIENYEICYFLSIFMGKHSESLISDIDRVEEVFNAKGEI